MGASRMFQCTGEVLTYKKLGDDYHSLAFVAPDIAAHAQPGQFVAVRPPPGRWYMLRRPFSIFKVQRRGNWAATVEVLFDVRGPGTAALAAIRSHDSIDVVGPLGTGFTIAGKHKSCLLVGGGVGATPLFFLAEELRSAGKTINVLWGASKASRLLFPIEAKRLGTVTEFATDDGSVGHHGRVTDVLAALIDRSRADVVYACGPNPMLAKVVEICIEMRVPVQVAMEEMMACGIGVCAACVVPVWNQEGTQMRYVRSCVEGPVFNGARVVWDGHPQAGVAVPAGN